MTCSCVHSSPRPPPPLFPLRIGHAHGALRRRPAAALSDAQQPCNALAAAQARAGVGQGGREALPGRYFRRFQAPARNVDGLKAVRMLSLIVVRHALN